MSTSAKTCCSVLKKPSLIPPLIPPTTEDLPLTFKKKLIFLMILSASNASQYQTIASSINIFLLHRKQIR